MRNDNAADTEWLHVDHSRRASVLLTKRLRVSRIGRPDFVLCRNTTAPKLPPGEGFGSCPVKKALGEVARDAAALGEARYHGTRPSPVMLRFRFTCGRHQQAFIKTVQAVGCRDPAQMDEVRRRLLAWFSERYPRLVLDHFAQGTCLGCEIEARFGHADEVRRAVEDLARDLLHPRHGNRYA